LMIFGNNNQRWVLCRGNAQKTPIPLIFTNKNSADPMAALFIYCLE